MTQQKKIEKSIKKYTCPYLKTDLISSGCVSNIDVGDESIQIQITLGFPAKSYHKNLEESLQKIIKQDFDLDCKINVKTDIVTHAVQQGVESISGIKNIIAVASGKGGVGKSTVSVNLALALSQEGASVGILDADIYGPSQPAMLGVQKQKPEMLENNKLQPIKSYDLQIMSIGFLVEEATPMIWRGPMITQVLNQLLNDTQWQDLDYLIIDLPPGTGDTQLTLSQKIPVSGAVIVTTPQEIALLDARKGLKMFEKVNIPILGIVENMSTHICSNCGHEEHIFSQDGGEKLAKLEEVDFLDKIPLDLSIREDTDCGKPSVVSNPDGKIAETYKNIAKKIGANLSLEKKNYQDRFPNIVMN